MEVRRVYLDTEFIEAPSSIELLSSIGLVDDYDNKLYAVNGEANHDNANPWVRENVLPHLGTDHVASRKEIAAMTLDFTAGYKPEFWGYYCDYDWVVFCWLFGPMVDLPKHFPMYCRDLKQWCDDLGNPELPKQTNVEHHALDDAEWNKDVWHFLNNLSGRRLDEVQVIAKRWHRNHDRSADDYNDAGSRVLAEHAFNDVNYLLDRMPKAAP